MPTLIITGSRNLTDKDLLFTTLDAAHAAHNFTLLVEGGANGADALACQWARSRGIPVKTYPADWNLYGRKAGPMRNIAMLEAHKDARVYAFPMGESKGTRHCIAAAQKRGMHVWLIES